jgi:hypothetical protein
MVTLLVGLTGDESHKLYDFYVGENVDEKKKK